MNDFKLIVTIGPSILNENKLRKINSLGNCIYRINGAHVDVNSLNILYKNIKSILPDSKIMLDLPGNKVRTSNLNEPIRMVKGESFTLYEDQVNFKEFYSFLKKGDIILANDSIYTLEVLDIKNKNIHVLSHSDGLLLNNKGLHVKGIHKDIPFLFDKDIQLIDAILESGIDYLSLSFVRTRNDIIQVKRILNDSKINLFAKVETNQALENLKEILMEVDNVLVDRGDLSTDINILELALIQDKIVNEVLNNNKNIFLATQFLKNMETFPVPLIPELIDLSKTIKMGINGIQLSEETAVGKYPIECVQLVFELLKTIQ